jgi:hypothetical protein
VARTFTSLTEAAVGLACLVGAVVTWRRGLRWVAVSLAAAGVAALAHALASFA